MSCWEESIRFYTSVNCRCQIWTNIYKVLIELIDNVMFVGVGFSIPLRNKFPEFWEFLGIPWNTNLFQDMQMSKDKKPWNIWEYLGMG